MLALAPAMSHPGTALSGHKARVKWSAPLSPAAKLYEWNGSKIAGISNYIPQFTGVASYNGAKWPRARSAMTLAALGPAVQNQRSISRINPYLTAGTSPVRHQSLLENHEW